MWSAIGFPKSLSRTARHTLPVALVLAGGLSWTPPVAGQAALQRLEDLLKQQATPKAPILEETVEPGYLGVIADDRNEQGRGVRVVEAVATSPGAQGGLLKGDLIFGIDGQQITNMEDMSRILTVSPAGKRLAFDVLRKDLNQRLFVTLGKRPPPNERKFQDFGFIPPPQNGAPNPADPNQGPAGPIQAVPNTEIRRGYLGVRTNPVDEESRRRLKLPSTLGALVLAVTPGSTADKAGLRPDDVLVAVNGFVVNRPTDLVELVNRLGNAQEVELSYYRDGRFSRARATFEAGILPPAGEFEANVNRQPLPGNVDDLPPLNPPQNQPPAARAMGEDRLQMLERMVVELQQRVAELEQKLQAQPPAPGLGPKVQGPTLPPGMQPQGLEQGPQLR